LDSAVTFLDVVSHYNLDKISGSAGGTAAIGYWLFRALRKVFRTELRNAMRAELKALNRPRKRTPSKRKESIP
jgi:hypothetical protein